MSILSRFEEIVNLNVSELLDNADDFYETTNQIRTRLNDDLEAVTGELSSMLNDDVEAGGRIDRVLERLDWFADLAKSAIRDGDDDTAKMLINSKKGIEAQLIANIRAYRDIRKGCDNMKILHDKLVQDFKVLDAYVEYHGCMQRAMVCM